MASALDQDWAAAMGEQQQPQNSSGFFNNANPVSHLLGNVATFGQRLGNVVRGLGSPAGSEFIPQNKLNDRGRSYNAFVAPDKNDYYAPFGAQQDFGDRALLFGAESLPFFRGAQAISGGAKLKFLTENMLAGIGHGGFFGNREGTNNINQAAQEGLIEAPAGYGVMKGLSFLGQPVGKYVSNRLVNPLLEKAAGKIDYKNLAGWRGVQDELRNKFKNAAETETGAWNAQTSANAAADAGAKGFKPKNFVKHATDALSPLNAKIQNNPNLAKAYEPSINNLKNAIENPPKSYQEAQDRIHDLNAAMKLQQQATGTQDLFLNKTVADLKKKITSDVEKGSEKLSPSPFKALQAANKATIEKQSISSMPQISGKTKQNKNLQEFFGNKNEADEGMLSVYKPQPKELGIDRFQKLERDLGSKEMAQQVMQKYLLRDSFKSGEPDLKSLLNQYNKFSPSQQKWLFNKDQNDYLKAASKAKVIKSNREEPGWSTHAIAHKLMGIPGVVADTLGGGALVKKFASPEGLERSLALSKNGLFSPKGYLPNALINSALRQRIQPQSQQSNQLDADWASAFGAQ